MQFFCLTESCRYADIAPEDRIPELPDGPGKSKAGKHEYSCFPAGPGKDAAERQNVKDAVRDSVCRSGRCGYLRRSVQPPILGP